MTRTRVRDIVSAVAGAVLITVALVLIWVARFQFGGTDVYVSELGGTGAPTARVFEIALLLVVAGGALVAFAGKDVRSRIRLLAFWTPAVSIWIACAFFLAASQVTCRAGCPLPTFSPFDWQDLTHITCAVLAFVAACLAMLQTAFAVDHRHLARFSLTVAIAVAVISGLGGILSLARFATAVGGYAEFTATTLAIAWVVVYGGAIAIDRARGQRLRDAVDATATGDISSSSRLASPTSM
jgi:heme A synthase